MNFHRIQTAGYLQFNTSYCLHTAFICGCVACLTAAVHAGEKPLLIQDAWESPESIVNVAIKNVSTRDIDLRGVSVDVSALWILAEPEIIRQGQQGVLKYLLSDHVDYSKETPVIQNLMFDGEAYALKLQKAPIVATYAVFDPAQNILHLYFKNPSCRCSTIHSLEIGQFKAEMCPVVLKSGQRKHVAVPWTPFQTTWPIHLFLQFTVESTGKGEDNGPETVDCRRYLPVFLPGHTVRPDTVSGGEMIQCLTHAYPTISAAAKAAEVARREAQLPRTIKFCTIDLADGPQLFGQLAERCHIVPQLAHASNCFEDLCVAPVLLAAQKTKYYTEPGIFYARIFPEDMDNRHKPLFAISRIRNACYACLAAGSKGIELAAITNPEASKQYRTALAQLSFELDNLHELIALSEPIDCATICRKQSGLLDDQASIVSNDLESVHTLFCPTKGLLIIVFPTTIKREPAVCNITIDAPAALAESVFELGGKRERIQLGHVNGLSYGLEAYLHTQVRVFFCSFSTSQRI